MIRSDVRDGVTIRNPSTANLLIDSSDATSGYSADFKIAKKNSILNGFFSRLAVSEVVLNWGIPNVIPQTNNTLSLVIDSAPTQTPVTVNLPLGFYTVQAALDALVILLNGAQAVAIFSITTLGSYRQLTSTVTYNITPTVLSNQLNFYLPAAFSLSHPIFNPVLLNYNYIDFVCNDITYNQSLKDATTNVDVKDILYRWWFSWDNVSTLDTYGFPILQGYTSFVSRRPIAFPKQVRWENNMPLGNLRFQVYGNNPSIGQPNPYSNPIPANLAQEGGMTWGMTLLVSED
jgi:hypothetical protein